MLTKTTIIRAWRDKAFRNSLTEDDLENLPPHPSGLIELSDKDSRIVAGGTFGVTSDPAGASVCWQCPTVYCCSNGGSIIVKGDGCVM